MLIYLPAFFVEAAGFLATLGLAAFVAVFFSVADLGFLVAVAFLTLGAPAGLAAFFAGAALFLAAAGFAVAALVFGFTCFGFLVAFVAPVALADLGTELEAGLAALAFLGLPAEVVLLDLVADAELPEATFLAFFGPGDFDAARFLVAVADPALPLEALFFGFLVDDFVLALASPFGPNLNEPLAPLPLVCLKYCDLTPLFRATFKC